MNNLSLFKQVSIAGFQWRDRKGSFHYPSNMETRHLFMTLVMIWNHTMPASHRIFKSGSWVHHFYTFGPFYTKEYAASAILAMSSELFTRHNLEDSWIDTLNHMKSLLTKELICD